VKRPDRRLYGKAVQVPTLPNIGASQIHVAEPVPVLVEHVPVEHMPLQHVLLKPTLDELLTPRSFSGLLSSMPSPWKGKGVKGIGHKLPGESLVKHALVHIDQEP